MSEDGVVAELLLEGVVRSRSWLRTCACLVFVCLVRIIIYVEVLVNVLLVPFALDFLQFSQWRHRNNITIVLLPFLAVSPIELLIFLIFLVHSWLFN